MDNAPAPGERINWQPPLFDGVAIVPAREALYTADSHPICLTPCQDILALFPSLYSFGEWDCYLHE